MPPGFAWNDPFLLEDQLTETERGTWAYKRGESTRWQDDEPISARNSAPASREGQLINLGGRRLESLPALAPPSGVGIYFF